MKRVLVIGSGGSGKTTVARRLAERTGLPLLHLGALYFLDVSRLVCLWRVVRRRLRHAGGVRAELAAGCPERLTWEFVKWIWTYPARRRADILRRLQALGPGKRVVVLRSMAGVERFLAGVDKASS